MKTADIFLLARNAIKSNRLRTNLTIAIIAIGITALIGIVTIIEILKQSIHDNFSSMGANTFTITSQPVFNKNKRHGQRKVAAEDRKISLQEATDFTTIFQFPAEVSISTIVSGTSKLKRGEKETNPNVTVMGTDEHYAKVAGINLVAGRNFTRAETNLGIAGVILGNAVATRLFEHIQDAPGQTVSIGDEQYVVIGVMGSKGSSLVNRIDNMAVIPMQHAKSRYSIQKNSMVLSIWVNDMKYMSMAIDEAEGAMRKAKKQAVQEDNAFAINKNDEIANSLINNLRFVTLSASIIGFITLLGAAIGLMNIMLVSVAERTREIGLSKAIGANEKTIRMQFLSEAVYISLKGGAIGMLIGILIGNLISIVMHTGFVVPWMWILAGFTICFIVGLMAGIYPALKASKLNPIIALRYE